MEFKPGLYPNVPRAKYDAIEGCINISTLMHGLQSMAHLKHRIDNPDRDFTPALQFGIAAHIATFERETFKDRVVQALDIEKRSNADKETWAQFYKANVGKIILKKDVIDQCFAVRDAIWRHPMAAEIVNAKGFGECTALWNQETESGEVQCKGMLDRLCSWRKWPLVADLKSAEDASPKAFQKSVANYFYHVKAAWYLDGLSAIAPLKKGARRFFWIAVEKTAPYGVAIYEADGETLDEGRKIYRRLLNQYAAAKKSGIWKCYSEGVEPLSIPTWAKERKESA